VRKNILVISPYNPFGSCLGGSSRTVRTRIERMSKDAMVTILTLYEVNQEEEIARALKINTMYARYTPKENTMGKGVRRLWNIISGRLMVFTHIDDMVETLVPILEDVLTKQKFDLIQKEDNIIGPIAQYLPKDVQKILFFHNVMTTYYSRIRDSKKNIFKRFFAAVEWYWIKRFEKAALRFIDAAIVITDEEQRQIRALSGSVALYKIPLEVDTVAIVPHMDIKDFPSVAFCGTMSYPPNEEAVLHFAENILPLIRKQIPGIKFYIVGRNPGVAIKRLSGNTVFVTGTVENVQEYLSKANVIVVPVMIGAGMRIKILEAFAMGKAVVSSSLGAEGIGYSDGENIMIADESGEFAQKVIFLIENKENAETLGSSARKLVEMEYDADVVWKKWQKLYGILLD
jgi:glycosyltransferase involved in cell wall biosynthesis